jgi:predicted NUDIX family phosphoesterase
MLADERVLVIPAAHLAAAGPFTGFRPADPAYFASLLDPQVFRFLPRSVAETDPAFLQLIPYAVLRCGGRVFRYRRGATGTEARLRSLWSVGVGGHISEADAAGGDDPYRAGMRRELAEEVTIGCGWADEPFGFVFDPRSPVGTVHLGVVHLLTLDAEAVTANETSIADGGFAPLAELVADRVRFETWSQFAIDELGRPGQARPLA